MSPIIIFFFLLCISFRLQQPAVQSGDGGVCVQAWSHWHPVRPVPGRPLQIFRHWLQVDTCLCMIHSFFNNRFYLMFVSSQVEFPLENALLSISLNFLSLTDVMPFLLIYVTYSIPFFPSHSPLPPPPAHVTATRLVLWGQTVR